ncbi:MAG: DNA topoisomerase IB [Ignavibacteria bacterium]
MKNSDLDPAGTVQLNYTNSYELCIIRKRKGKRFIYTDSGGKEIMDKKTLYRIDSLVIPPAWENVLICTNKNGHIQAVGRDSRGRKQYIYHPFWSELSSTNKFSKLIDFAHALPSIRKHVEFDLKKKSLTREKVLAVIIKLMESTLIRIGNNIYAEQNNSFGLTTLKDKHLEVDGYSLNFEFIGKSGKPFKITVADQRLARIVKKCQDLPGQRLFQYIDETGTRRTVESVDVNNYLNRVIEKNFTAKDFRTWGATLKAAKELKEIPLTQNEKENKRNIIKAIKHTAHELNNTPAVCRKYYLHPAIIDAYLDGYLFKVMNSHSPGKQPKYGLDYYERAVLKILLKYNGNNDVKIKLIN